MLVSCAYFALGAAHGILQGISKKLVEEPIKAGVEAALQLEKEIQSALARATPEAIGQWLLEQLPLPASAHQQQMLLDLFETDRRIGGNDARATSYPDVARARALLLSRGFGGGGASVFIAEGNVNNNNNATNYTTGIDYAIHVDARSGAPEETAFFAHFVAEEIKKEMKKLEEEKNIKQAPVPLLSVPEPEQARKDKQEEASRASEAAKALSWEEERNNNENEKEEEKKKVVAASSTPKRCGLIFNGDWSDLEDSDDPDDSDSDMEEEKEEDPMEVDGFSLSSSSPSSATSAPVAVIPPKQKERQTLRLTRTFDSASSLAAAAEKATKAPVACLGRPPLPTRDAAWALQMRTHLEHVYAPNPTGAPPPPPPYCTQLAFNFYCREHARRNNELACVEAYSEMQQAMKQMDERGELSRRQRQLQRASELRTLQEQEEQKRQARQWRQDMIAAGKETLHNQIDFLEAQKLEQKVEARRQWDDPPVDVLLEDDDERFDVKALATPPHSPPRPRLLGAEAVLSSQQFHVLPSVEVMIAENMAPA